MDNTILAPTVSSSLIDFIPEYFTSQFKPLAGHVSSSPPIDLLYGAPSSGGEIIHLWRHSQKLSISQWWPTLLLE